MKSRMLLCALYCFIFNGLRINCNHPPTNILPYRDSTIESMRIPEDTVTIVKAIEINRTEEYYKIFEKSSKRMRKRFRTSRALLKRKLSNATRNVIQNMKQILIPKYKYHKLNITELTSRKIDPLLVFVNKKSGGKRGVEILKSFNKILSEYQICDLSTEKPKTYIRLYRHIPSHRLRILCCGGDGSIQWIMNEMYDAGLTNATYGVLPLGTGNDLYLYLFGTNTSAAIQQFLDKPQEYLEKTVTPRSMPLDRWGLNFRHYRTESLIAYTEQRLINMTAHPKRSIIKSIRTLASPLKHNKQILRTMNNYFGIGVDGAISIQFHNARNTMPFFFFSSLINKFWYACVSISNMFSGRWDLNKFIDIKCDGKPVHIPPHMQGIVCLNINSYAGGSIMWAPKNRSRWQALNSSDGIIEIVGVTGVAHLAQIKAGLSSGIPLAQGRRLRIKTKEYIPMQIDGEPWLQRPCKIQVSLFNRVNMFAASADGVPCGARVDKYITDDSDDVVDAVSIGEPVSADEEQRDAVCAAIDDFVFFD